MATKYTFLFTDTAKSGFDVFPYTANGPVTPSSNPIIYIDHAVNARTTLKLYGKGMQDYGEGVEQNLIYMLENFANNSAPVKPIEGQQWYNNVGTGSPPAGPELFIYNNIAWDAIILATGTSPMTGELILSGNLTPASNTLAATPKLYVDNHIADNALHLTVLQNSFLDGLTLTSLTSLEVDQLIGINTGVTVQAQLDGKLSLDGTLAMTGELTLSGNPVTLLGATSKQYVDGLVFSGANDTALSVVDWIIPTGSPLPIIDVNATTLQFTIMTQGSPAIAVGVLTAEGISKVGHIHSAVDVIIDNTFNTSYSTNLQSVIEEIDTAKANLAGAIFTGTISTTNINVSGTGTFINPISGVDPINSTDLATKNYVDNNTLTITRNFEARTIDLISGTPYQVQNHVVADNKLSITINGLKQYVHTHGSQQLQYDINIPPLQPAALTGIDQSLTYEFDVAVDGSPAVTITIPALTDTTTHGNLSQAINSIMSSGSPPLANAIFNIESNYIEKITSNSSGGTSSVVISDPGGSPSVYLFGTDTGTTIIGVNFYYNAGPPDEIILQGDVTAAFPVDRALSIRSSNEPTYGNYNGAYRVHVNGPLFNSGSPGTTTIPIASLADSNVAEPLIPGYTGGSPAPSPVVFGSVYITPIVGFDIISPAVIGINGDYTETDSLGNSLSVGYSTNYVVFNYDILAGGSPVIPNNIETLLIS